MQTILVVEDDPNQSTLYAEELTEEGYNVLTARSGREALRGFEQHPDLAVLDINLPDMDGLQVLAEAVERHPKLPIVIHTAYASYQDSFHSWAADAYVVKNSDLTELKARVKELLAARPRQTETDSKTTAPAVHQVECTSCGCGATPQKEKIT
jgi:DNA-binding response OmpR family regulator